MKCNYTSDGLRRVCKQKTEMYTTWKIGLLPVQGTWLGLVSQSLTWGSMVCVHWNFLDRILKTLGGLMEKPNSQPRSFMFTINSFKLIKSNHEYQIMKYISATLCQDVVPQNKMKQWN